jgi:hypothetical protein
MITVKQIKGFDLPGFAAPEQLGLASNKQCASYF